MNTLQKPLIPFGWLRAVLFFIFFILVYSIVAYAAKLVTRNLFAGMASGQNSLWVSVNISALTSFLSVWVFRKWIDRRSFSSLGFPWKGFETHAAVGGLAAIAMLGIGSLLLVIFGYLRFSGWNASPFFLVNTVLMMLVVALSEELVFRGYLLHNLMQSTNKWLALLITSALFALIHLGNPGAGFLPILEIFIAGLMLGINYIYTRNLWFGIALHFAWNFFQGPVFGYKVSGMELPSLMQQELTGPAIISGGSFGLEGSILSLILNGLLIVLLFSVYNRPSFEEQFNETT